jgi:hypothetical protein
MNRNMSRIVLFVFLLAAMGAVAQQSPAGAAPAGTPTAPTRGAATVRGCLDGSRGNYIVIEDQSSMVYVLKGVGNKLDNYLHHEVEVKGRMLPGTIKTGIREEKMGSNPSDTVHGVDGVPLQVADVQSDIHMISKHCKAADQE